MSQRNGFDGKNNKVTSSPATVFPKPENELNDEALGEQRGIEQKPTPWYGHLHLKKLARKAASHFASPAEEIKEEVPVVSVTLAQLRLEEKKKLFKDIFSDAEYQLELPLLEAEALALCDVGVVAAAPRSGASLPGAVQVLPAASTEFDIRKTINEFESNRSAKSVVNGQHIIIYVGVTSTGKTFNIKELLGCQFKNVAGRLSTTSYPAMLKKLVDQEGLPQTESQTSQFTAYDLTTPEIVKRIDYKLKSKVFVCDSAGMGDTNILKTMGNILDLLASVRDAASVRVVVQLSSYGISEKRGEQLKLTIQSLARNLPEIAKYTSAIRYEFSKQPPEKFIDAVDETIKDILKVTGDNACTSDERALLLHMLEQVKKGNITFFSPNDTRLFGEHKHTRPISRMEKNMALKPITDPKSAFRAYVEKDTMQPRLETALSDTSSSLDDLLVILEKNIHDVSDTGKKGSIAKLYSIFEKIEELKFINDYFIGFDVKNNFMNSMSKIEKTCESLKKQAESILNVKKAVITDSDIEQYQHLQMMYACLHSFITFFYQVPAPAALPKNLMRQLADEYCDSLRAKLNNYNKIHQVNFEQSIGQQLLGFVEKLKPGVDASYHGLPATTLVKIDELAENKINRTLDAMEVKELEDLNADVDSSAKRLARLEKECGDKDIDALKRVKQNLTLVEKAFDIKPVIKLETYFQETFKTLKVFYRQALELHDFETAFNIILEIKKLNDVVKFNLEGLGDEYVDAINALIPSEVSYTNKHGELELTEAVTKQFIYAKRIVPAVDHDVVAKIILDRLEVLKPHYIAKLDAILTKSHDVRDINSIAAPLQQFVFALSVFEGANKELTTEFERKHRAIRTFVINIAQSHIAKLALVDVVLPKTIESYAEMYHYLTSLSACSWVSQLELLKETRDSLMPALAHRFETFLKRLKDTNMDVGHHENIAKAASMYKEMVIAQAQLSEDVISQDVQDYLSESVNDFNTKLKTSLGKIQAVCDDVSKSERLSLSEMVSFSEYLAHCKKSDLFVTERLRCTAALEAAIIRFTNAKIAKITALYTQLSAWQAANNETYPSNVEVAEIVVNIKDIFTELEALSKTLPLYYARSADPLNKCKVQLEENLEYLDDQFDLAYEALLESRENAATKFGKMLLLCNELSIFDRLLPLSTDADRLTFKNLHERMETVASEKFQKMLAGIVTLVRAGDYDAAFAQAETISIDKVKQTLSVQVSAAIDNLVVDATVSLRLLENSKSAKPDNLDDLITKLRLLDKAKLLRTARLLDDEVNNKRNEALKDSQQPINQWLANCEVAITKYIAEFDVKNVILTIAQLVKTIELMPDNNKPENHNVIIDALNNALAKRAAQVTATFAKPVAVWTDEEKHSLHDICRALFETSAVTDDDAYAKQWLDISAAALKGIESTCTQLDAEISSNRKGAKEVLDVLKSIEAKVMSVPKEPSDLKAKVNARCQKTMTVLMDKISADTTLTFDGRFKQICQIMSANDAKTDIFAGLDTNNLLAPLHQEARKLSDAIRGMIGAMQIPTAQMQQLVELHAGAFEFDQNVVDKFEEGSKDVKGFIATLLKSLNEKLTIYQSDKNAALLIPIKDACEKLKELNLARKNIEQMLPADFSSSVTNVLKRMLEILNDNQRIYTDAFENNNVDLLKDCLEFTGLWSTIVKDVALYIEVCSENPLPDTLSGLKAHQDKYNLAYYVSHINQKIVGMIAGAKLEETNDADLKSMSEEQRKKHFKAVTDAMSFITRCDKLKSYLGANRHKEDFLALVQKYLQGTFAAALKELPAKVSEKTEGREWEKFNNLYKELLAFTESCNSNKELADATLEYDGETKKAVEAAKHVKEVFFTKLQTERNGLYVAIDDVGSRPEELRINIIDYVIGLQRIINNVPMMSLDVKRRLTDFLNYLSGKRGYQYLELLAKELQEHDSGLGVSVINEQKHFRALKIATRNARALTMTAADVLAATTKRTGMGPEVPLDVKETVTLADSFSVFENAYVGLRDKYLAEVVDFDSLTSGLGELLAKDPVQLDANKKPVWYEKLVNKLPLIVSYLFAIWTLRDTEAYFQQGANPDSLKTLKTPNPAQLIAIFRLLGLNAEGKDLKNHIVQVLSGQGKSIVLAVVNEVLALVKCAANNACYSEYLSTRDLLDFVDMFEMLHVEEQIQYGTFNIFMEKVLNRGGDLRTLVKNLIEGNKLDIKEFKVDRYQVGVFDEVDVFFSPAFSKTYNPFLSLQSDEVEALIKRIWTLYQLKDCSVKKVSATLEYKACVGKYNPQWTFLFEKAVAEMVADLGAFKGKDHAYKVDKGKIAYEDQDGLVHNQFHGYKTMWAYFSEHAAGKIDEKTLKENIAVRVNCGNFFYREVLKQKGVMDTMLGTSGTVRELSAPELNVVVKEFGIQEQTFIPSAFGESKLKFNKKKDVKIAPKVNYARELANEIVKRQLGEREFDKAVRPCMVFFDKDSDIANFSDSEALKRVSDNVGYMTKMSSGSKEEQDAQIKSAVSLGRVTLAEKEMGRGRDTICTDSRIDANGGAHALIAFFPDHISDEHQIQNRAARQGYNGSTSMILCKEDLMQQFKLSAAEMNAMIARDNIYDELNVLRVRKFEIAYAEEMRHIAEAKKVLHDPSMALWSTLQAYDPAKDQNKVVKLLQELNQVPVMTKKAARTLVLIDATGSMGGTINGVKAVISDVLTNLALVLSEFGLDPQLFALQLAIYRNYNSMQADIFDHSPWSTDTAELLQFIKPVRATGGGGYGRSEEAMEVGLKHALIEADKEDGLSQVIVIGDIGANTDANIRAYFASHAYGHLHSGSWYVGSSAYPENAEQLCRQLKDKNVPVHGLYVNKSAAEDDFKRISQVAGGQAEFMDVSDVTKAKASVIGMFGKAVIAAAAGKDDNKKAQMLARYNQISFGK